MAYSKKTGAGGFRITPEAIELYRRGKALWPGRLACIQSAELCTHESCDEQIDIELALDREIGLRPWDPSIFDMEPGDRQPAGKSAEARAWPRVRALWRELEAAL